MKKSPINNDSIIQNQEINNDLVTIPVLRIVLIAIAATTSAAGCCRDRRAFDAAQFDDCLGRVFVNDRGASAETESAGESHGSVERRQATLVLDIEFRPVRSQDLDHISEA